MCGLRSAHHARHLPRAVDEDTLGPPRGLDPDMDESQPSERQGARLSSASTGALMLGSHAMPTPSEAAALARSSGWFITYHANQGCITEQLAIAFRPDGRSEEAIMTINAPVTEATEAEAMGRAAADTDGEVPLDDETRVREWKKLMDEYQAEHGAFTEDEIAQARRDMYG